MVTVKGSTIWVPVTLKEKLDKMKAYEREAYYEVIERLVETKSLKRK